jgi:hypothetical protein
MLINTEKSKCLSKDASFESSQAGVELRQVKMKEG